MLFSLLFENPILFFLLAICLVLSLSIHEFAHAYTAYKLGDDTAKYLGRVTLNPAAHLDPIGTLLLLFVGIGWGKPVPFNPYNLKNPQRDGAIISVAGPLSNIILAVVFALIYHLFANHSFLLGDLFKAFSYLMVYYNLFLAFFNLIPVHPLDGFKVVYGLLPRNLAIQWIQFEQYGIFILLMLVLTRSTGLIIEPFVNFFIALLGING